MFPHAEREVYDPNLGNDEDEVHASTNLDMKIGPMRLAGIVAAVACAAVLTIAGGYYWFVYPSKLLNRANDSVQESRWLSASQDLERYVWFRPGDSKARMLLAKSLLSLGPHRSELAVHHLRQIDEHDPLAAEARVREAEALVMALHRAAEAETALRQALKLDPDSISARQGLCRIYWWEGRKTPEFEQWLEEIYQLGNSRQRLSALGQAFWLRYAEYPKNLAYPMMQNFLQGDPQDYGAALGLARTLLDAGRRDEGLRILEDCLTRRPDDFVPRALLTENALDAGDWARAGELIEAWPESAQVTQYWELRGRYLEQGERNFAEAIPCFQRAIEKRPDHWSTRYRLSQCLSALGRSEESAREREFGDRTAHALLDTRVQRLLDEVLPNIESRPHGCDEIAELYDDVGFPKEAQKWRSLGRALIGDTSRHYDSDKP